MGCIILVVPAIRSTVASLLAQPAEAVLLKPQEIVYHPPALPEYTSLMPIAKKIPLPPAGALYHGVYPGDTRGSQDGVQQSDLAAYQRAAGKSAAWVYFSNEWSISRRFPLETATWIRKAGQVPFIRLMLRSKIGLWEKEPTFTLANIIRGDFDDDLNRWAQDARSFGTPLILEYGTEVNGDWFSWNGRWNGAFSLFNFGHQDIPDGAQRFRVAYQHIISIFRREGASNITWVFHANGQDYPSVFWNRMEAYYPGDDWIDWLGVSIYGAQKPTDLTCDSFSATMDSAYERLAALSPGKPIVLLEFGVTNGNPLCRQADWVKSALQDITSMRWPRLIGFSWWNEGWPNDNDPTHNTSMRVQDNPPLAALFRHFVAANQNILSHLVRPES